MFCKSLSQITVDENNSIYDSRNNCNAIIETASNTLVVGCNDTTIPDSVITIGGTAFEGSGITSLTVPSNVTSIGQWAFVSSSLTNITLNEGLSYIGYGAFQDTELKSISIPKSVIDISNNVLSNCVNLKSITYKGVTYEYAGEQPSSDDEKAIKYHFVNGKITLWNGKSLFNE